LRGRLGGTGTSKKKVVEKIVRKRGHSPRLEGWEMLTNRVRAGGVGLVLRKTFSWAGDEKAHLAGVKGQ